MDFKSLPPCQSVLRKKVVRANYLAYMMKQATRNIINAPSEGWSSDQNGRMSIDYFDGDAFPKNVTEIAPPQSDDEDDENVIDDSSSENESEDED